MGLHKHLTPFLSGVRSPGCRGAALCMAPLVLIGVAVVAAASIAGDAVALASSPGANTVMVSEADNGASVALRPGDSIAVQLAGSPDLPWEIASSSNRDVLRPSAGAADPATGDSSATLQAKEAGSAQLVATSTRPCSPSPCASTSISWFLDVEVTP